MFGRGREEELVADGGDEGDDLDVRCLCEDLLCDRTCCYPSCSFRAVSPAVLRPKYVILGEDAIPIVSLALLLPPPLLALTPYFSIYVQSA